MRRILFVDDEPRILDGLRRMLRPRRTEWEMGFAVGGEAALACFDAQPYDVVVTDMRMPGMDGAALLARVRERSPETVRIVLSGYADPEDAARAARVAHDLVGKPAAAEILRAVIALHTTPPRPE
jgi:YesN/AraC family two-component response regulator